MRRAGCIFATAGFYRGADAHAAQQYRMPSHRQAKYFTVAVTASVFLVCAASWLLAQALTDGIIDYVLHRELSLALAVAPDGQVFSTAADILVDKVRNRVAFPELYAGKGADIVTGNAVNWYYCARRLADTLSLTAVLLAGVGTLWWRLCRCRKQLAVAQQSYEGLCRTLLLTASTAAVLCSIGIVVTLLAESALFFTQISIFDFLFGLHWNPQVAIRADQTAAEGAFGFLPLLSGTLLISAIAMAVAFPAGLMIAVYTSEYATRWQRNVIKPAMEILTGIPTVVYGAFAAMFAGPWLRDVFSAAGLNASVESALAVGIIMGIMIMPLVSSLIDDSLRQVPSTVREGMYAIGATRLELVTMVLLPASLPGITGALLLSVSRAFGETMIVVMAAGLTANLTANPLEAVTTVTVQIATILVGDQAFDSIKTLSAFSLGLTLFIITLLLNILASWISRRYAVVYQ